MSNNGIPQDKRRPLLRAIRGAQRGGPDESHLLVRAIVAERRLIMFRNPRLRHAVDSAEPGAVAAVRGLAREHGVPLSLELIQDVLGAHQSSADRKSGGAVYTPGYIVRAICDRVIAWRQELHPQASEPHEWTVLDPAVGAGAFLVGVAGRLRVLTGDSPSKIIGEQLYGLDVSETSVAATELLLSLWALLEGDDPRGGIANLQVGTALDGNPLHRAFGLARRFDAVIGNPPYVRIQNLAPALRRQIRETWPSASFGNIDLYIPFIELGLEELADDGVVGYVVPGTFTTTNAGRPLRELLLQRQSILEMIDFDHHQVFDGVTTYASLLFLSKQRRSRFGYAKAKNARDIPERHELGSVSCGRLSPRRWQLISDDVYPAIHAIESAGAQLGDLGRVGVGIATLADACYLLSGETDVNTGSYVKDFEGRRFLIEPGVTCPIVKAGTLKSEEELRDNQRRILFPYRLVKGRRRVIAESRLKREYPNAYEYLTAVKPRLDQRDRGKPNPAAWYAFGRSQGVDSNFGRKLLTPALSLLSNFVLCDDDAVTFYGGYCVQTDAEDLRVLQKILNSPILDYYLHHTGRSYRYGYKSFARAFLQRFGVPYLTDADRADIRQATDPDELVAMLFERYRLDPKQHPDLAAYIAGSPKMRVELQAYPREEADSRAPRYTRREPEPRLF